MAFSGIFSVIYMDIFERNLFNLRREIRLITFYFSANLVNALCIFSLSLLHLLQLHQLLQTTYFQYKVLSPNLNFYPMLWRHQSKVLRLQPA